MPLGRPKPLTADPCRSTPEACVGAAIVRHASIAGGLGACCARQRGARGAEPPRIQAAAHDPAEGAVGVRMPSTGCRFYYAAGLCAKTKLCPPLPSGMKRVQQITK